MRLATVVGQVVATVKEPGLEGFKILLVEDVDPSHPDANGFGAYAAIDLVGAGEGEVVVVATGSAARIPDATVAASTDAAVVGIADSVIMRGEVTFKK